MDAYNLILKSVLYIEDNLKDITSVSEVVQGLNISVNYLNRIYNRAIGYTTLDYIKMRKITQGILSGSKGRSNIIDIAFEYGFNSHEVFIRSCKRYFKKSPRELLKLRDWRGCNRIDERSLWYMLNKDKIKQKKVKLPSLVLKEAENGDFSIYSSNKTFFGQKSELNWNMENTYKLIPGGIFLSYSVNYDISIRNDFRSFLKNKYLSQKNIIEYKKLSNSIFYVQAD